MTVPRMCFVGGREAFHGVEMAEQSSPTERHSLTVQSKIVEEWSSSFPRRCRIALIKKAAYMHQHMGSIRWPSEIRWFRQLAYPILFRHQAQIPRSSIIPPNSLTDSTSRSPGLSTCSRSLLRENLFPEVALSGRREVGADD